MIKFHLHPVLGPVSSEIMFDKVGRKRHMSRVSLYSSRVFMSRMPLQGLVIEIVKILADCISWGYDYEVIKL